MFIFIVFDVTPATLHFIQTTRFLNYDLCTLGTLNVISAPSSARVRPLLLFHIHLSDIESESQETALAHVFTCVRPEM